MQVVTMLSSKTKGRCRKHTFSENSRRRIATCTTVTSFVSKLKTTKRP